MYNSSYQMYDSSHSTRRPGVAHLWAMLMLIWDSIIFAKSTQ